MARRAGAIGVVGLAAALLVGCGASSTGSKGLTGSTPPAQACGASPTPGPAAAPSYAIGFTRHIMPIDSPNDIPTAVVVQPRVVAARVVVTGAYDTAWSPNGKYVATQNGHGILVTSVPSPRVTEEVAGTRFASSLFVWSPDSQLIAEQELSDVIVTNVSGSVRRVVGRDSADTGSGEDISWAPDGAYVTYIGSSGSLNSRYIVVASAVTGADQTIAQADAATLPPTWSPDSAQLAFDSGGSIWMTSLKGGTPRKLVPHGKCYNTAPAWSPDGRSIAFLCGTGADSMLADTSAVCMVGAGGGTVEQLTPFVYRHETLKWSPDSKWIASVENLSPSAGSSAHTSIFAVPASGGAALDLSGTATFDGDPMWLQSDS